MFQLNRIRTGIGEAVRTSNNIAPILLAIVIGAGAGLGAIAFRRLITGFEYLFFDAFGGAVSPFFHAAYTIPVLALGGLIVGLITHYLAPETKGHGVPEVMYAVARQGSRIRPRVTVIKAFAAAVCIGSGGSAGREGPIVQIGSALGSSAAQLLRLPDRQVTLAVACGAAGAIAATFNAPIAGVMFALEVIVRRFTSSSFGYVVLSSTTATIVSRSLSKEGDSPAFAVLDRHGLTSVQEIFFFFLLGVLCAVVARAYTKTLYYVEDLSDGTPIPSFLKPAIGGALVGAVGIWVPEIFGTGYETIEGILNGRVMWEAMLVFCVAKIACTAFTIGSGGSGGVFAPALFIGAAFGGLFGHAVNGIAPSAVVSEPGSYALVAMAAVFGAAAQAPITAILILFEMTDDYRIIIPLMSATVLSTFVAQAMSSETIYTAKLRRRGIYIGTTPEVNLMDAITVSDAMESDFASVPPDMILADVVAKMSSEGKSGYPVISHANKLVGVVTSSDVEGALLARHATTPVEEICSHNVVVCRPDQTLSTALTQFGTRDVSRMPVIDPHDPERVIGMLYRTSIIEAYNELYRDTKRATQQIDEIRSASEGHQIVMEQETITVNGRLAGMRVRDAGIPPHATLAIVQRGAETVVPRGSTELKAGDLIVLVSNRNHRNDVRAWLKANC